MEPNCSPDHGNTRVRLRICYLKTQLRVQHKLNGFVVLLKNAFIIPGILILFQIPADDAPDLGAPDLGSTSVKLR